LQNWESYLEKTNLFFLVYFMKTIMCLLSMTYRIVLEHCLFPLSCKIISICILVVYRFILTLLYFPYLFVREYYFGL